MFDKKFKDFTFFPQSSRRCLIKVIGPQGKAIPFAYNMDEMEELQKAIDWSLGRMYKQEKLEEDAPRDYDFDLDE